MYLFDEMPYLENDEIVLKEMTGNGNTEEKYITVETIQDTIKEGEFKVYDSATGLGRRKVRYAGFTEERAAIMDKDFARCIFTITFKVNDPVTFMTYYNGSIVETRNGLVVVSPGEQSSTMVVVGYRQTLG